MNKEIIQQIKDLGFHLYFDNEEDEGVYYEVYKYWKDESSLEINFDFDKEGKIIKSFIEFERIELKGAEVTIPKVKQLIKLIYNIDYEN